MSARDVRLVEGRKFMWDGRAYPSREEAVQVEAGYAGEGFETYVCEETGEWLVYTRRAIKQVIVEHAP